MKKRDYAVKEVKLLKEEIIYEGNTLLRSNLYEK